jgi:hypothetical protein
MNANFRQLRASKWLFAALCLLAISHAAVSDVGVVVQDEYGRIYLADEKVISDASFNQVWNRLRGPLCDAIRTQLGRGDLIASGVTLYDITCNLNPEEGMVTQIAGTDEITVRLTLKNGYLEATSTTPTVFGSYADPRFSVSYDVNADVTISVPRSIQSLTVKSAHIGISNAAVDSHNFVGDLIAVGSSISHFFGGPDYIAQVESVIDSQRIGFDTPLTASLGSLNQTIQQMGAYGFPALKSVLSYKYASPDLLLTLTAYTPRPPATAPQNCSAYSVCGDSVEIRCYDAPAQTDQVVVLQRLDSGVWHDVSVDSSTTRSTIPDLSDKPGDGRDSAYYRACNRNSVGDTCMTESVLATFSHSSCSASGGSGGGDVAPRQCGHFGQPKCGPILFQ